MPTEVLLGILALLAVSASQADVKRPAPAAPIVLTSSSTTDVSPIPVSAADQAPQLVPVSGWKSRTATVASLPSTLAVSRPVSQAAFTPATTVSRSAVTSASAATSNLAPFPAVTQQMPVLPAQTAAYPGSVSASACACSPAAQVPYIPQQVTYVPQQVGYLAQAQAPVATYRPVVGATTFAPAVSTGLYGQPTLYVPGQPLRNFLRYLSP